MGKVIVKRKHSSIEVFSTDEFESFFQDWINENWSDIVERLPRCNTPCGSGFDETTEQEFTEAALSMFSENIEYIKDENSKPITQKFLIPFITESFSDLLYSEFSDIIHELPSVLQIKKYIEVGSWNVALMSKNGDIFLTDVSTWPMPSKGVDHRVQWELNGETYTPVVWYGLSTLGLNMDWAITESGCKAFKTVDDDKFFMGDEYKDIILDFDYLLHGYSTWFYELAFYGWPNLEDIVDTCPINLYDAIKGKNVQKMLDSYAMEFQQNIIREETSFETPIS